ncbi:hypothetical protein [Maricaulis sp. CAU 1757]
MLFARLARISTTLFLSMVMALAMLALLGFYQPHWLAWFQDGADLIEDAIAAIPMADRYNNFVRIFASDDQILVLIFTIIARIMLAFLGAIARALMPDHRGERKNLLGHILGMTSTLFLSFILAIVMLSFIALTMEGVLHTLLNGADWVEDQLARLPVGGRWRAVIRYVVSDEKIVLLFFTIIARILIAVLASPFAGLARRDEPRRDSSRLARV